MYVVTETVWGDGQGIIQTRRETVFSGFRGFRVAYISGDRPVRIYDLMNTVSDHDF